MDLPDLHTIDEVAQMLGRSTRWVREQCDAHRLGHIRHGRDVFFRPVHVQEYLERQELPAGQVEEQVRGESERGRD